MDKGQQLLSDLIVYKNYSRYLESEGRRETFKEIIDRNVQMHLDKFSTHPKFREIEMLIEYAYQFVYSKNVLPSMRSLQYAGEPIKRQPIRMFNCCYVEISDYSVFNEVLYLLLMGCGVGYSVQKQHIEQLLPAPKTSNVISDWYTVQDSSEGWADAIKVLFYNYQQGRPTGFDYSKIRPKGSKMVTSGGIAPGYEPLKKTIDGITNILYNKKGKRLTSLECHDILCRLAECVLAGGNRRSALLCLFDKSDEAMFNCKSGNWFETSPHFSYSNNSVVLQRNELCKEEFFELIKKTVIEGYGEPGIFLTNSKDFGCNPCCEASLENKTCCNLTTINVESITSVKEGLKYIMAATIIGSLQAAYTDSNYISKVWQENTRRDGLLGVSFTGVAGKNYELLTPEVLRKYSETAVRINKMVCDILGIPKAKRIGLIKPEGSSSCVLGTSSGIHPYYAKYYIRRVRINKNTSLFRYLSIQIPNLIEYCNHNEHDGIVCIPCKAPDGALTNNEDTIYSFMERIRRYKLNWIDTTHAEGENTHNISCTMYYNKKEGEILGDFLHSNISYFNGITIFPKEENNYSQAPFEEITKEAYEALIASIPTIDFTFKEEAYTDNDFERRTGCSGASCSIL